MDRVRAESEVRQLIDRALQAWNAGDLQAIARCYTMAASYVAPDGSSHQGHAAIEQVHRAASATKAGATVMRYKVEITHPAPGLAIAVVEGADLYPGRRGGKPWIGSYVVVLTPEGEWLFASAQVAFLPADSAGGQGGRQ